ncbi:MAG: MCE family protein [Desulfobacterales bacterium]|nr:MCE family protein [Desulfobacterales bacterium]
MKKRMSKAMIGGFVMVATTLAVVGILVFGPGDFFADKKTFVMYFKGSVKGLNVGAPVVFRGVRVGTVTDIMVRIDARDLSLEIPVFVEIERERFSTGGSKTTTIDWNRPYKEFLKRGLRARLEMQSLVTGQLVVALDFYPDAPLVLIGEDPDHLEIPTIQSSFAELVEKLEKAPVEEIFEKLMSAMEGIEDIVNKRNVEQNLRALSESLEDIRKFRKKVDARLALFSSDMDETLGDARALLGKADGQVTRLGADIGGALEDARDLVNNVEGRIGPIASDAEATLADARKAVQEMDDKIEPLTSSYEETARAAAGAMERAEKTLKTIRDATGEDALAAHRFNDALHDIAAAARSIETLVEYIERNPETLLMGNSRKP